MEAGVILSGESSVGLGTWSGHEPLPLTLHRSLCTENDYRNDPPNPGNSFPPRLSIFWNQRKKVILRFCGG
jgi:hypothetical protein